MSNSVNNNHNPIMAWSAPLAWSAPSALCIKNLQIREPNNIFFIMIKALTSLDDHDK